MNRRQMLRAAVASALVTGLGACSGEPEPASPSGLVDPGTPAPRPSPTPSLPAAPLSGAPVAGDAIAARQAVAVPVRVTTSTSPAGLAAADVVYQEFAEAGTLHLTAVFQSREATKIGPVTEVRPVDVRTLGVLQAFVGYAGAPTGFQTQFVNSGLKGVTPGQQREAFASGYTSTAALYKAAPKGGLAPSPIFDYAAPGTPLATQDVAAATELTIAVPGRPAQVWRYDGANLVWTGRAGKVAVAAASVLVLTMPYRTLTVRHPTPRSLPSANVYGDGAAVAVSGPFSAKAKWRKPGQKLVCHITDLAGYQIRPLPGAAWVIYAPTTAKVTVR